MEVPTFETKEEFEAWANAVPEFPLTVTFSVTKEDIENGKHDDCMNCPIAIALTRATGYPCQSNHSNITLWHRLSKSDVKIIGERRILGVTKTSSRSSFFMTLFDTWGTDDRIRGCGPFSETVTFYKYGE